MEASQGTPPCNQMHTKSSSTNAEYVPYNFALTSVLFASSYITSKCSLNALAVCGLFSLSLLQC